MAGYIRLIGILFRSFPLIIQFRFHGPLLDARSRQQRAERVRKLLVALGPTFIKIGQALANRPDLVPYEYLKEFEKLLDSVPPFWSPRARWMVRRALSSKNIRFNDAFKEFPKRPIASASLGQVYDCRLQNGERVAVKVQRPGMRRLIQRDIAALMIVARYAEKRKDIGLGLNWTDTVREFSVMISEELDFERERANGELFAENFKKWKDIHVPRFYPEYSTRTVLVMEFIDGKKLTDVSTIRSSGQDPLLAMEIVIRSYLKQLIEDGFYHADPHPGNLRYLTDGRVAFFDFGMAGKLEPEKRSLFLDLLIHVAEKDVENIVKDLAELGFLRSGHAFAEFQPAVEAVFHRYLDSTDRSSIRFHEIVYALSEVVYRYPFTIPTHFTYILRALLTLEGLGMSITPAFSFFRFAKPYAAEMFFLTEAKFMAKKIFDVIFKAPDSRYSWERMKKFSRMVMNYITDKSILDLNDKKD
ncbi:MAG: AarF/ABC1/UbiB kinase family protein [Spirochaetia bacterium]|nr:AarF/ABC1/UbiB kinase family protein [Spirochaetia bacterium]